MDHYSIENFSNLLVKPISKYIKQTFCIPNETTKDKSKIQLETEENFIRFIFIICIICRIIIESLLGIENLIRCIQIIFLMLILLLLMKNQYHSLTRFLFFVAFTIVPYFWSIEEGEYKIFRIPLITVQVPVYCYLLTRSLIYASISFTSNMVITSYIFIPKLKTIFEITDDDPRAIMFDNFANYVFVVSLSIALIVSMILNSREKTIIKLLEQQEALRIISVRLNKTLEEKDNFLLSVSHEFRNPLNGVSGNIELVDDNVLDSKCKRYIQNAKTNVDILVFVLNNMMDSAKLHSQNLALNIVPTDMKNLFETSWAVSKLLIHKKDLSGAMYISKNMPDTMNLDEVRIKQVIYNLVSNASKYTDDGYVCIICNWIPGEKLDDDITKPTNEKVFRNESSPNLNSYHNRKVNSSFTEKILQAIESSIKKYDCEFDSFPPSIVTNLETDRRLKNIFSY